MTFKVKFAKYLSARPLHSWERSQAEQFFYGLRPILKVHKQVAISDRVCGLPFIFGDKGAKFYDADVLMRAVYCGRERDETLWEETDAIDLGEAMGGAEDESAN